MLFKCFIFISATVSFLFNFACNMGCGVKAKCHLVGPGPVGRVPSVGVFLRDPSPYLC